MRPSGKWQSQIYFKGKSRYIGVFDTMAEASRAYEIARDKLSQATAADGGFGDEPAAGDDGGGGGGGKKAAGGRSRGGDRESFVGGGGGGGGGASASAGNAKEVNEARACVKRELAAALGGAKAGGAAAGGAAAKVTPLLGPVGFS